MIIDCVLDRKHDEETMADGYTHSYTDCSCRELRPLAYDPKRFYNKVFQYIGGCGNEYAYRITLAMDYGTEEDVQNELCRYIEENDYNNRICGYIRTRTWLTYSGDPDELKPYALFDID